MLSICQFYFFSGCHLACGISAGSLKIKKSENSILFLFQKRQKQCRRARYTDKIIGVASHTKKSQQNNAFTPLDWGLIMSLSR